ncbi:MAG: hypothetical protein R3F37_12070 [Candidatus Competibacteraceae bacterium]
MTQQYNEQILKQWAEAQKRFRESFASVLPKGQAVTDTNWWQNYSQNLSFWENTVKQTLTTEAALMEQWMQQMLKQAGEQNPSAGMARQLEGAMRHWLRCQAQLWDECFAMLRGGEINSQSTNKPSGVTHPEATADPADAWDEPAETDADAAEVTEMADVADVAETTQSSALAQPAVTKPETTAKPVATPYPPDDLKTITGIGPALEKKLNEQGIISYRQLAELNEQEVQNLETTVIKFPGRIQRDQWIDQAKEHYLRKYGKLP